VLCHELDFLKRDGLSGAIFLAAGKLLNNWLLKTEER
jgi:hypothetical protein